MVDDIPDQAKANSCNGTWEESESTMHGLELHQFGIYHHNKNKGNTDLSDDTNQYQIDIMPEGQPESVVVKQLNIVLDTVKGFPWTTFPLKKAVYKCRNKWYKHGKDKYRHRQAQIQEDCFFTGFDGG